MRSTVALSTQPDTSEAIREIIGPLVVAAAGERPDLVVLFATPHHQERIEEVTNAIHRDLAPGCLIGCTGQSLIGADQEYEDSPCVVAFSAHLPGLVLQPLHCTFQLDSDTGRLIGFPFDEIAAVEDAAVLMFADPFSMPMDALLRMTNEKIPGVPVIGGMASGATMPGKNRMFLEDRIYDNGAVGVVLSGDVILRPLVSQGCRPVGKHYVITRGSQNVIAELGGMPALTRLQELLGGLDQHEQELLGSALHIGRAINEYQSDFERGDFLVRSVLNIDHAKGAIAISDFIRPGQTVQFHVRDPGAASEDLELLLQGQAAFLQEHKPVGALLFSCNGRGTHMFGVEHHDARAVRKNLGDLPLAGFFAGGELGPIGGKNFIHGFTACLAVFCEK